MRKLVITAVLACICQAAFSQLDKSALTGLLERIVKDKAGAFVVEYVVPEGGKDVFEVAGGAGGRIVLRGSNGVCVASALNYYLRHYCHVLVSWNGGMVRLPTKLPEVKLPVHKRTPYDHRYYLNYCTFNYSMAWWDWSRWQREIDWMAMNGINMPLALTGEEAIWQEVYRGMGFTDAELDRFFTGPAYFSWLWMGNIDAWGGPLPAHWKESHKTLQKKILAAERAFGMKPVLPAFTGHVPPAFSERFPAAKVKRTNWDAGFADVYILDPGDPMFEVIGRRFLEAQTREYGTDHFYSADTFNENVPPTTDSTYLDAMSKRVFASMAAGDPAAVWVMQGWMFHYNASYWQPVQIQALLKAVPDDHMILLDLYSESHPVWNRTAAADSGVLGSAGAGAYYGKPWIWNMLHNFGGNNAMWGRMSHAALDPSAALHDPGSGKMVGIGLTPEGIEQNPALYQLLLENVWQDSAIDVRGWLKEYARERYGVEDRRGAADRVAVDRGRSADMAADVNLWAEVDEAWRLLEGSVYRGGLGEGGPESIIQARPTFEAKIDRVLTRLDYDPAVLVRAWGLFVQAAPQLGRSDGFRYDLVDVTRQVLANYASPLQQEFVAAWRRGDTSAYRRYSRQFRELMDDIDRLLATRPEFLLGRWIRAARNCGVSPAEKDLYEKNARDLITLWGDKESGLREYSNRQWSGLISGFYRHRWEMLFARLDRGNIDWAAFDKEVKEWEWQWVNGHERYEAEPKGDAVKVVMDLYKKYQPLVAGTNDHIFPAAAVARSFIDFDGKGFIVKGKRCFLVSAGIEYARVPHELWQDRLQRLKRAGFNCIETYTFWNFHEPKEGRFDFSGDHDLEAFLRLVGEMGMYAIVRVGPYYCAEWDNGGYPLWLKFKPGVRVREDNAEFLGYADRFFDRLLPIVCRQQIRFGGPVILVQLENEHNLSWGTAMPNGYFRHLREKALSKGLEVPYFFSGLHHASDPVGDAASLDDPARPNPWFSTEFWSVWYNGYGSGRNDSAVYARRSWKIISHGGGGYNYYMAHGGSNFGYTNNDEDAASYDYGAAVGQAGDLRPIYYAFKRAAMFARSFQGVLADGTDATARWEGVVRDTAVRVTARHSLLGDVIFLDNSLNRAVRTEWGSGEGAEAFRARVELEPGEILPIVHHFAIGSGIRLEWTAARVAGITEEGALRTMVVEGEVGREARLEFIVEGAPRMLNPVVSGAPQEFFIRSAQATLRVLVMSRGMADRTWFADKGYVICGADYVGDMRLEGRAVSITEETRGEPKEVIWVYGPGGKKWMLRAEKRGFVAAGVDSLAALSSWTQRLAGEPARREYDDHSWLASERPLQMGADGDLTADAWYRSDVRVDTAGEYTLLADGGDRATVFVDGVAVTAGGLHSGDFPLRLTKGEHSLAMFTAHDGRDKLAGFYGSMADVDRKGLAGEVRLEKGRLSIYTLAGWRFLPATGPLAQGVAAREEATAATGPLTAGVAVPTGLESGWMDYSIGADAFGGKQGFGWFRVVLPEPPASATGGVLDFRSTDENATIFLNGRRVLRHEGWNLPFRVNIDRWDTLSRPLVLTVFIENYSNEGGIDGPVQVHYFNGSREVLGWRMHGGITEPGSIEDWVSLPEASMPEAPALGQGLTLALRAPCYYRAEFRAPAYVLRGEHPIWRVHTDGLGHGSVWVNGHHLGRYPEKTPAPGIYIPECWLKAGANELVVFDEDGRRPDSVSIRQERAAGRRLVVYSVGKRAYEYVDPMIGTGRSDVKTKWGNEGGTYPGAVAPWGFVQMTPETRAGGGYDHSDAVIGWFSCFGHMSGYPDGSAGRGRIMPVDGGVASTDGGSPAPRAFLHADEEARPGYYRVLFRDNGTLVETTASERVGWMRCTYPAGVVPCLYVAGLDGVAGLHFNRAVVREDRRGDGRVLTFASSPGSATVVEVAVAVGMVSLANAKLNWEAPGEMHRFDEAERQTRDKWRKILSVVNVEDEKEEDKIIFYTALYHSLLIPWILSDADGRYRGRDGRIHAAAGKQEYGGFSPWDSFRSQQPLLCLLFPEREKDIILSMMDVFRQTGFFPTDPMTGNHSIPIIVDAWLKGIRGGDPAEVFAAMRKGILGPPYRPADREMYHQLGYLPLSYPESVTRTMEYAYDDWALAQFAKNIIHRDGEADSLFRYSHSYRNLFDVDSLFFLPRGTGGFQRRPGTSGYKEGDRWVYSYFVPQYPLDLVNLLGGDRAFVHRLDEALAREEIVFDNETVFHIPYLFAYAGAAGETQDWVRALRDGRFACTPGGLPGNDDLGAFSSWYVFSALGFFPMCPGRPEYVLGTALFRRVTLRPPGGRELVIRTMGSGRYVRSTAVEGRYIDGFVLADSLVRKGGVVDLQMGDLPQEGHGPGEKPAFVFSHVRISKDRVEPNEPIRVWFTVTNTGSPGTAIVRMTMDGREYVKHCLVAAGGVHEDSMDCRLYRAGKNVLRLGETERDIEVVGEGSAEPEISGLVVQPILRVGQLERISYSVRNIGGSAHVYPIPVVGPAGRVVWTDTVGLLPGESKRVERSWIVEEPGLQKVEIGAEKAVFKVYAEAAHSLLLSLSMQDSLLVDHSGFGNTAHSAGEGGDRYVEVGNSPSLDQMGETLTMAAWVYPAEKGDGLVDILTKGDDHVLQVKDNRQLSFFAGGWGRGDCTVDLPVDWFGRWHHIAGVCTGDRLKVYIDGQLKGVTKLEGRVNLSVTNKWTLGRNEEFPGQRLFKGTLDGVQIWAEPLDGEVIRGLGGGGHHDGYLFTHDRR